MVNPCKIRKKPTFVPLLSHDVPLTFLIVPKVLGDALGLEHPLWRWDVQPMSGTDYAYEAELEKW